MSVTGVEASKPRERPPQLSTAPRAGPTWRRWSWRRPFDYVVAALAVCLAAVINIALWDYLAAQPSALFFAAVMVSAWFGGLGPGLLATGFATFLSVYLFTRPFGSLDVDLADVLRLNVFLMVALLTSWLTAARERAETALRMAHADLEQRVALRTSELRHLNEVLAREVQVRRHTEHDLLQHQSQLSELAAQLSLIEERERRRIATLLHDDVGQMLSLTQMRLEEARQSLKHAHAGAGSSVREAAEGLDRAHELLEQAIARARGLTCELSPPILYELGCEAAIEWLVEQTRARCSIDIAFESDRAPKPLSEQRSIVLFQAVRELLANCLKHSRATRAAVRVTRVGDEIHVEVTDNGVGFAPQADGAAQSDSFGLFNVRERLRHEDGQLQIDSAPAKGSRIVVTASLEPEAAK